jgi:pyruvoyl-dependent arginine decarboxylase (PvlArgDC)
MMKRVLPTTISGLLLLFAVLSCTSVPPSPLDSLADLVPVPDLAPEEVVAIQLAAFQANDTDNRGIALAYRFASPRNKALVGTVDNFASILRNGNYAPMLAEGNFRMGLVERQGPLAFVAVRVETGEERASDYLFVLTRQKGGEYDGCWMTDAVVEIEPANQIQVNPPETIDS